MSEEELKRMEDFVNATLKPDKPNEYRLGYEDALRRCYYFVDNLQQENKQLKERINIYENPDDMTLMFMWCDEKAKDKIKDLQQRIDKAIEYIKEKYEYVLRDSTFLDHDELVDRKQILHILEILGDKE